MNGWTRWNGDTISRNIDNAGLTAVDKTAHLVLSASIQEVPLDEKTLMKSGIVIIKHERVPIAIISFGGGPGTGHPIVPYAIRWHETKANFQHGRKWKYLKDPLDRLASRALREFLRQEIGRVLR